MRDSYCFSAGPPTYYWKNSELAQEMNLKAIPKTASVIPGSSKVLKVRYCFSVDFKYLIVCIRERVESKMYLHVL